MDYHVSVQSFKFGICFVCFLRVFSDLLVILAFFFVVVDRLTFSGNFLIVLVLFLCFLMLRYFNLLIFFSTSTLNFVATKKKTGCKRETPSCFNQNGYVSTKNVVVIIQDYRNISFLIYAIELNCSRFYSRSRLPL